MSRGNVKVTDLPEEQLLNIFSFLDAEDLIACVGVNATWNELTNRMDNRIWFEACLKAGIYVEEDKYENARDWKAFLSSMLRRLKAMQDSTCFSTDQYVVDGPVENIYCYKDKIAIAFRKRIQIRNVCEEEILHEFECGFAPVDLKFDDKILVAVSTDCIVSSWSMTTGNFLGGYSNKDKKKMLISFDFLTEHDIVASGYLSYGNPTFIKIWSMSSDNVCKITINERNRFESVILAPKRDLSVNEQELTCYLFSLTSNRVNVMTVTLQHRNLSTRDITSLDIPPDPIPETLIECISIDRTAWRPLFDGNEVYFTRKHFQIFSLSICAWNFRTNSRRYLTNLGRITKLLGVGEKYIVYEAEVENNSKRVVVANKITAEIIAIVRMLHRKSDRRYDHLCLTDTSWLDGINGENDRGPVCARVADDKLTVQVTQFVLRNE